MGSLAIFGAARGMEAGKGVSDAYKQKLFAQLQRNAIKNQMHEIDQRASIEIGQIFSQGERVVAEQTAAFVKGGVDISGSAMDVLSDTMSDAAEAAYIRRREADYELAGLKMQDASLKEQASDLNFFLNSLTAVGGAAGGFAGDMYAYNKGSSMKSTGAFTKNDPYVNRAPRTNARGLYA